MLSEEHGHAHAHGTGIRWVDLIVAVSAIFISVVSLFVSVEHGRTMERMVHENEKLVAANTLPLLTFASTQVDPATGKPVMRFVLRNGGVGPAVINWFQVSYQGKSYARVEDLLRACCEAGLKAGATGIVYSNVSNTILPARDSLTFLDLGPQTSPDLQRALGNARRDLDIHACYC